MENKLISSDFSVGENDDGVYVERYQEIPQWWIDQLKEARAETKRAPSGEYHRAASIPQVVVDKWLSEGYDVFKEPVSKSLAKLRAEGLDYFITTDKQL
jgi:hypothetical protein